MKNDPALPAARMFALTTGLIGLTVAIIWRDPALGLISGYPLIGVLVSFFQEKAGQ